MYTPSSFKVEEVAVMHSFMAQHSFATVVSVIDGSPSATHLPFLIDSERGEFGTLRVHVARANPLWKTWTPETDVLVIFTGPHAYISPDWYDQKVTVPTWNYSAVHAYGRPREIADSKVLKALVQEQVRLYETKEHSLWNQSLMEEIMDTQLRGIVGFEIPIERLEGKFKFNQNRSLADQEGVTSALERSGCPFKKAAGAFMRALAGVGGR